MKETIVSNPYTNQHKEKNQISNIRDQTVTTKIQWKNREYFINTQQEAL